MAYLLSTGKSVKEAHRRRRKFIMKPCVVGAPKVPIATDYLKKIQKQLEEVNPDPEQGIHSIFEVPKSLRELEPVAFAPHLVSIGPYHRNANHLKEMEKHKMRILKNVLKPPRQFSLESLFKKLLELEEETRNYYDKPFQDINKQQFVEMMLLDACFILEVLSVFADESETSGNTSDPFGMFNLRGFLPFIQRDLLILENQLPFSVLHHLFSLAWKHKKPDASVAGLALKFFKSIIPGISQNLPEHPRDEPPPWLHLLHVVYKSLEPPQQPAPPQPQQPAPPPQPAIGEASEMGHRIRCPTFLPMPLRFCHVTNFAARGAQDRDGQPEPMLLPCCPITNRAATKDIDIEEKRVSGLSVTRLRSIDIIFEENKDSKKFTHIEYKHGKLLIPRLLIHGSTKSTFLNLMAFEQCYPDYDNHITSYISFMDGLINTSKDVEHLIEKRIIVHELGSEEDVACLFNNLRKEIVFDTNDYYLSNVSEKLNDHYQEKWRTWKATLKHEYFKDPWKIVSLVAASVLIFLTTAQTVYAIVGYHHPST